MVLENITALISVYEPNNIVKDNIKNIVGQVTRAIICDNSIESHRTFFADIDNVIYISNKENLGIPAAYNLVLRDESFFWDDNEFVIFFDQDSHIENGYIDGLIQSYLNVESYFPNIGCMGPIFFNTSNNKIEVPKIKKTILGSTYKVDNVITSSMIVRYKNLRKINFWNDNLFLDFADWDLCWRMEKEGLLCAITEDVTLYHSVGFGQKSIGPIHLRVGAPFREYYQTRDAYYLLRENYVPKKMRLRLWANIIVRPIVHNLFLDNKNERKKYRRKGKNDFKKGLHGEIKMSKGGNES